MQNRPRNGSYRGVPRTSTRPGPPPEPPEEDTTPKTTKERLTEWRRNARATMSGVPRALSLVWGTHKGYTITMALLTVLQGVIPALTAWISKLLIDAVVAAIKGGATQSSVNSVVVLVAFQLALFLGGSLLQTVKNINQQALQELTAKRIQLMLMQHANKLDLSFFENPKFYDLLQQAQREATFRPTAMVQQTFGLVSSFITFASMIALITRLG